LRQQQKDLSKKTKETYAEKKKASTDIGEIRSLLESVRGVDEELAKESESARNYAEKRELLKESESNA